MASEEMGSVAVAMAAALVEVTTTGERWRPVALVNISPESLLSLCRHLVLRDPIPSYVQLNEMNVLTHVR